MDEIEPRKTGIPNSTFETQKQDDGSMLLFRHGVPVGRLRIVNGQWAGYFIDGAIEVCRDVNYNESLYELSLRVQNLKLKQQLKKVIDEKR